MQRVLDTAAAHAWKQPFDGASYLAVAQARAGDTAAALRTLEGNQASSQYGYAISEVAAAQARAGEIGAAMQTATNLKDEVYKAFALDRIATVQASAGNTLAALNICQEIGDFPENVYRPTDALSRIAAMQTLQGDTTGAEKTLARLAPGKKMSLAYATLANTLLQDSETPGD